MNAIWNPCIYFFVKIYVGFVADIDIKILGVPPQAGHAIPRQGHLRIGRGGGVIYFCQGFLLCMMPSMDR